MDDAGSMPKSLDALLDAIEETALLQAFWRATEGYAVGLLDPLAADLTTAYVNPDRAARFSAGPAAATYARIHVASVAAADRHLAAWGNGVSGARQLVVLGSGFDGRARRLALGRDVIVFLVDRPRILELLTRHDHAGHARVLLVEANLAQGAGVVHRLLARGWRPDLPTAIVAEGIAEFLGGSGMRDLLRAIRGHAIHGTSLLQLLDPALVAFARHVGDAGFPWRKLPSPIDVLGEEIGSWTALPVSGPTWVRPGGPPQPLVHVYARGP